MHKNFGTKAEWHFFAIATTHRKNACDGVGGL